MRQPVRIQVYVLVLATLLVSACGASSAVDTSSAVEGGKPQPAPVEFTGIIESVNGTLWTVSGQVISVDPSVVRDGPFNVGDTVKVEANVQGDGSMVVMRVESPSAVVDDSASPEGQATENPGTHDAANTSAPAGGLVFDNNGKEASGTIDSIDGNTIVIGGQPFQVANGAELASQIVAGDFVKVHFTVNADGTLTITEIQLAVPGVGGEEGDDDSINNAGEDANDDNGTDSSHDSGGNDDNSGSGGGDHGNSGGGDN